MNHATGILGKKMKLYSHDQCPFAQRVSIALLNYQLESMVEVEKISFDNPPRELLNLNPSATVPTLEIENGKGFAESMLILDFFAHHYFLKIENSQLSQLSQLSVEKWEHEKMDAHFGNPIREIIYAKGNIFKQKVALQKLSNALAEKPLLQREVGPVLTYGQIALASFASRLFLASRKMAAQGVTFLAEATSNFLWLQKLASHPHTLKSQLPENQMNLMDAFLWLPEKAKNVLQLSRNELTKSEMEQSLADLRLTLSQKQKLLEKASLELNKDSVGKFQLKFHFDFLSREKAMLFLDKLVSLEDSLDHHCNCLSLSYKSLEVSLQTHEQQLHTQPGVRNPCVSALDVGMAQLILDLI